jgi:phage terminase large subunit
MFRSKPVHDWSSHAADSMRYLCVGLQELSDKQTAPQKVADNEYRIL